MLSAKAFLLWQGFTVLLFPYFADYTDSRMWSQAIVFISCLNKNSLRCFKRRE
jgi:hypothetical protein